MEKTESNEDYPNEAVLESEPDWQRCSSRAILWLWIGLFSRRRGTMRCRSRISDALPRQNAAMTHLFRHPARWSLLGEDPSPRRNLGGDESSPSGAALWLLRAMRTQAIERKSLSLGENFVLCVCGAGEEVDGKCWEGRHFYMAQRGVSEWESPAEEHIEMTQVPC